MNVGYTVTVLFQKAFCDFVERTWISANFIVFQFEKNFKNGASNLQKWNRKMPFGTGILVVPKGIICSNFGDYWLEILEQEILEKVVVGLSWRVFALLFSFPVGKRKSWTTHTSSRTTWKTTWKACGSLRKARNNL